MAAVERWSGRETRILREAKRMGVRAFAAHLGVNQRTVTKWEAGGRAIHPRPEMQAALDTVLNRASEDVKARFAQALRDDRPRVPVQHVAANNAAGSFDGAQTAAPSTVVEVERLRRSLTDTLSFDSLSEASVEDWERTAWQYGSATRDRPAALLLADLSADIAELERVLGRRHSAGTLRRLTRVSAQMAGLVFLTLIKLGERTAARSWARTARIAADEAGDRAARSWVRAQESYVHFYSGNMLEAVAVARHAQAIAGNKPCVGATLAAALEARAHATLGHELETRASLDVAEALLSGLEDSDRIPSAFGYNEAQLRFHEGNAFTHLHNARGALAAQERAMELYPPNDYMDRALVQLDRASCLVHDGDLSGMANAAAVLLGLTEEQRTGLITDRAHEVLAALPSAYRALPIARDLRDVLMLPASRQKVEPWC